MTHAIFRAVNAWARLCHPHLCLSFKRRTGQWPNVALPQSLPERFLWRKIFDHNPAFTEVQDKLGAKEYARRVCPEIRVPRVTWQGIDLADAPPALLQQPGMLKANHSCGTNVKLPDTTRSPEELRRLTKAWLADPYGKRWGEWAYAGITPKLYIEEFLENPDGSPLVEVKAYVCAGKVVFWNLFLGERGTDLVAGVFLEDGTELDMDWLKYPRLPRGTTLPGWEQVLEKARSLGREFDFLRVDMLVVNGQVHIGELTVYPLSGFPAQCSKELEQEWRAKWDLRQSWFLSTPQPGWRGLYSRALRDHLNGGDG